MTWSKYKIKKISNILNFVLANSEKTDFLNCLIYFIDHLNKTYSWTFFKSSLTIKQNVQFKIF